MKRNTLHILLIVTVVLIAWHSFSAAETLGDLIISLDPNPFTISPNGDNVQDILSITYELADTAHSLSLLILTEDSTFVVKTLVFEDSTGAGEHTEVWDGTGWNGLVVPDGKYILFLQAFNDVVRDSTSRYVFVDTTPPEVFITQVQPGIFAPDLENQPKTVKVYYDVSNSPPDDDDQIFINLFNPSGNKSALPADTTFAGNGSYEYEVDETRFSTDGMYRIEIVLRDAGANSNSDQTGVNADLKEPTITITNPQNNLTTQTIPDSLHGWTWDRNGINFDSLQVSYPKSDFQTISNTSIRLDTVFFSIVLADSLVEQKTHVIEFKSSDPIGRGAEESFMITLDQTPPPAPTLNAPPEKVAKTQFYTLTGTADDADSVRIYRNDSLIQTISAADLTLDVVLNTGSNIFSAISIDNAGNTSSLSNEVEVVFNAKLMLSIPQPFRSNDSFILTVSKPLRLVTIRIYDMEGNHVADLMHQSIDLSIEIPWSGVNGNGEPANRGPFVAVARISYKDGNKDTIRELFLFDP